jgi:hypothetical protein
MGMSPRYLFNMSLGGHQNQAACFEVQTNLVQTNLVCTEFRIPDRPASTLVPYNKSINAK